VIDGDVLDKISDVGTQYTLIDQMTHLWFWLGRTTALGDSGYRLNRVNKRGLLRDERRLVELPLLSNNDGGLPMALRALLNRKARSGTQDQVVTMLSNWEDFGTLANANAYDRNLIWLANHPWIRSLRWRTWRQGGWTSRATARGMPGTFLTAAARPGRSSPRLLQHATETNYDNWYKRLRLRGRLLTNKFEDPARVRLSKPYGMMYFAGLVTEHGQR